MTFNPELMVWKGCKAKKRGKLPIPLKAPAVKDSFAWYDYCLPAQNQNGPSCVGQAWANWLECMLRRYVGRDRFAFGEQIDGELIWRRGRKLFWGNKMNGGLYLHQGFAAMMDLKMLPPGSMLSRVAPDWFSVSETLSKTPIVQAHHVHTGWYRPHKISGTISHTESPSEADGYHATLLIALGHHEGTPYRVGQNSWGKDYGRHGYFVMTEKEWFEGACPDGLFTAILPIGWERWPGWKPSWPKFVGR